MIKMPNKNGIRKVLLGITMFSAFLSVISASVSLYLNYLNMKND